MLRLGGRLHFHLAQRSSTGHAGTKLFPSK